MSESPPAAVVVLAAGHGTRMRSALPKVLHAMLDRSLVEHVLAATAPLAAERTVVVIGAGQDEVRAHLAESAAAATPVMQDPPRGTADALAVALAALDPDLPDDATVVVAPGDSPLLTTSTLTDLVARHHAVGAAATLLSARAPDPTGYGRIVRDGDGQVSAVVEHRDADAAALELDEVNAGVYAFALGPLRSSLTRVSADNAQGELYLTDVVGLLVTDGAVVTSVLAADYRETLGVNDRVQLAAARRLLRDRIVEHWMRAGVTVIDPQTTWISVHATLEPDSVIHPNTQLHGATRVASFAEVGPDTTLRSTVVGRGASIVKSHCTRTEIGPDAVVGPFAHLRGGTRLGARAKAGAFVETKQAVVGDGSKIPHLAYVGDATIGERSNVGCGAVTVNYDGTHKHQTVIGDDVRIGSDTMLVAPVTIGHGATTGAGAVIRHDVPPGALAVSANDQRTIEDWAQRRRRGGDENDNEQGAAK